MVRQPRPIPCSGYPVRLRFPDVEPDELAREAAAEGSFGPAQAASLPRASSPEGDAVRPRFRATVQQAYDRGA